MRRRLNRGADRDRDQPGARRAASAPTRPDRSPADYLIINARDAIPAAACSPSRLGGSISTRRAGVTAAWRFSGGYASIASLRHRVVSVRDRLADLRSLLTRPMATEPRPGLSTFYESSSRPHGDIEVCSTSLEAHFTVVTCRSHPTRLPVGPESSRPAPGARSSEASVLFVEDEPRVRELVTTILDSAGHVRARASTAEEALANDGGLAIDVLLTDGAAFPERRRLLEVTHRLPDLVRRVHVGLRDNRSARMRSSSRSRFAAPISWRRFTPPLVRRGLREGRRPAGVTARSAWP